MKDLLKIISAKSLNIIAKDNKDKDEEMAEEQEEAKKKQEREEEIRQQEAEEEDAVSNLDEASDEELSDIEKDNEDEEEATNIEIKDEKDLLGITDVQNIPVYDKKKDINKNINTVLDSMEEDREQREEIDSKTEEDFREEDETDFDSRVSDRNQEKRTKENIFIGDSTNDSEKGEYIPTQPGDEERDAITRLKRLKERIQKRLDSIKEETEEGDTNE